MRALDFRLVVDVFKDRLAQRRHRAPEEGSMTGLKAYGDR